MIRRVVPLAALLALVAGCVPAPTQSASSVAASFQCTPEAGGSPSTCTQPQYDAMKRKDALYAEAEGLYRRYFAEEVRLDRAGGAREATPELKATIAETLLEQTIDIHRQNLEHKVTVQGTQKLVWLQRRPGLVIRDSIVAIAACRDASGTRIYQAGKYIGRGPIAIETTFGKLTDEGLRLFTVTSEEVSSCDA